MYSTGFLGTFWFILLFWLFFSFLSYWVLSVLTFIFVSWFLFCSKREEREHKVGSVGRCIWSGKRKHVQTYCIKMLIKNEMKLLFIEGKKNKSKTDKWSSRCICARHYAGCYKPTYFSTTSNFQPSRGGNRASEAESFSSLLQATYCLWIVPVQSHRYPKPTTAPEGSGWSRSSPGT